LAIVICTEWVVIYGRLYAPRGGVTLVAYIAFYVSKSGPNHQYIYAYDVGKNGLDMYDTVATFMPWDLYWYYGNRVKIHIF
jgi:hypothetical protein